MSLWLRWSVRDLRHRWLLVTAIALVIAVGTGMFAGLGSMESWRIGSNDASFSLLRYHDLRVSLAEGSFVEQGTLREAATDAAGESSVEAVDERLIVPSQVDASSDGDAVLVPGRLIGMSVDDGTSRVDGLSVAAGRGLGPDDVGRPTGMLEAGFAEFHGVEETRVIRVAGDRELEVVGHARSPEYFLVIPPGFLLGGEASFGVVFVSLATAQEISGRPGAVNDLVLRFAPGTDVAAAQADLERALPAALGSVGFTIERGTDADVYRVLYEDASNDQTLMNVFAFLVLGGAALATFNLVGRMVEATRREIGIGMAVGAPPRLLALRPLLLGVEVALLGALFGIGVGYLVNLALRSVLESLLPLPVLQTPFEVSVFARAAAVGFALPVIAAAYPVWRGVRVAPIEAIEVGARAAKGSGLARHARWLRLPGHSVGQMPLRNVLRTPRRTLVTALGVGAVVAVLVAMLGMLDSFFDSVERIKAETGRGAAERLTVDLAGFVSRDGPEVVAVVSSESVGSAEPRLRVPGVLSRQGAELDAAVELLDSESQVWTPSVVSGRFPAGPAEILLSTIAARALAVGVGDSLILEHPRRAALEAFELVETEVRVAGLHPSPLRSLAYLDESAAELFGLSGLTNTLAVAAAPGKTAADAQRSLFGLAAVASAEDASAGIDAVEDSIGDWVNILRVVEVAVLLLVLLIAFNAMGISTEERVREHATMFAFGLPVRAVIATGVIESILVGLLGLLAGIAVGYVITGWVVNSLLPEVIPELGLDVVIRGGTLGTAVAASLGAMALAPILAVRRLRRMDLPGTLRVVE